MVLDQRYYTRLTVAATAAEQAGFKHTAETLRRLMRLELEAAGYRDGEIGPPDVGSMSTRRAV